MHGLLNQAVVVLVGVGGGGGFSSLNTLELRAAIMWRRCDHDRREYRPHRHQGVGRGINPLHGQTFCLREDNASLIVNRQSSIVYRQSSIVNRQSSVASGRATDPGASGRGINPLRREITLLKAWYDCVQ
jgi:hypothetical protein